MPKSTKRPDFSEEIALWDVGVNNVCGIDEAGRGCWAGPIVAGAVVFNRDISKLPNGVSEINDSKKITPKKREKIAHFITNHAKHWGIGYVTSKELDKIGLTASNILAMERAVLNLGVGANFYLVDGNIMRNSQIIKHFKNIIKGDSRSLSIAAASIIAKVFRDKVMESVDTQYPEYDFGDHKGYGTEKHRKQIKRYGILPIHRKSFAPIKELLTL